MLRDHATRIKRGFVHKRVKLTDKQGNRNAQVSEMPRNDGTGERPMTNANCLILKARYAATACGGVRPQNTS